MLHLHALMWPATSLDTLLLWHGRGYKFSLLIVKATAFHSYLETQFQISWSTALYSRAPRHRRDSASATCPLITAQDSNRGIQGSSLITKEQKLPVAEWEKQVNRTKRAICYTCASQKNAYIVLSELSALLCLLVQLNQSIPQVGCYRTGAGKLNQTTQFSTRD